MQAWVELGYPAPTGPRQLGRLTRAITELGAISECWDEVNRKDGKPTNEMRLLAVEVNWIYQAREFAGMPEGDMAARMLAAYRRGELELRDAIGRTDKTDKIAEIDEALNVDS